MLIGGVFMSKVKWKKITVATDTSFWQKGQKAVVAYYNNSFYYIIEKKSSFDNKNYYITVVQRLNPAANQKEFYYGRAFNSFTAGQNYYEIYVFK